jgi:hypothetical protein
MTDNITLPRAVGEKLRERLYAHLKRIEIEWWKDADRTALAALDAALAEPDAIARAVEAEREACAALMERQHTWISSVAASAAIRARGSK